MSNGTADETIQKLRRQLEALVGQSSEYKGFLDAVSAAEAKLTLYHTQDRYGRLPLMTKDSLKDLMWLHQQIGKAAEGVFRENADPNVIRIVKRITSLAAGNHRAMLLYEPEKGLKTLPALLAEARTVTVDTRGAALKNKMSGEMSSRQPITFLDNKGQEHTGLFTPKSQENHWEALKAKLASIASPLKEPAKSIVAGLADRFDQKAREPGGQPLDEDKLHTIHAMLMMTMEDPEQPDVPVPEKLCSVIEQLFPEELGGRKASKVLGANVVNKICDALGEKLGPGIVHTIAKIPDGSRIDSRNSAMSAVADLLNISGVIARSRPMTLIGPDGKEVEGTFMAEATGMDIKNLPEDAQHVSGKSVQKKNAGDALSISKACKQISDLQVLDFLCGNVDRHRGNLLYQFDENHKLCGVQGIDNDCSFGVLEPSAEQGVKEMTCLNGMNAISESTYNAVMNLTPEALRFTLRGFGLSEQELQAAGRRLETMQEKLREDRAAYDEFDEQIQNKEVFQGEYAECYKPEYKTQFIPGRIRVIKETERGNEWGKIKYSQLAAYRIVEDEEGKRIKDPLNLYGSVEASVSQMATDLKEQKKAYQSLKSSVAIGSDNRALPEAQAKEATKARKMAEMLQKRTTQGRSSPQYDAMLEAVEEYALFQLQLRRRIEAARKERSDPDAPYESIVTTQDIQRMRELSRKVKDSSQAYLTHKGGGLHIGYTAKRIEAAKLALEMGEQGAKLRTEELDIAEHNEKLALEEVNRRVGDKLESSGWEAGKESPFAKNDFDGIGSDAKTNDPPQLPTV